MVLSFIFFSIAVFCIYIYAEQIRDQLAEKIKKYVVEKIQEYVALPVGDYLDTPIGLLLGFLLSLAVLHIAGKIRETLEEKFGEYVAAPFRRHLGYVYFYKSNIEDFRTQREKLEKTRDEVQRLVDAAEREGEVVLQNVQEWLTKVNKIIAESRKLFDDERQSILQLLYRRSRYAKEKTVDVDELIQLGINFNKVSTSAVRFGSRDGIFEDIMEALKDDKIKVIGIHGMPGVGKTTLAKQVMQQAEDDKLFDGVRMAVVSQTPDWDKIRREIEKPDPKVENKGEPDPKVNKGEPDPKVENKGEPDPKVENKGESQREGQGSTRDKKRILIVLDDIWENVELDEAVGISFGMKQEGWKVVLTSRKKDVYDRMGTDKNFSVAVINEDEAWNLFRKTAGDSIESSDLHPLAVEIAKECAGLPIAIVTIASTIKGKDKSFLRNVLNKQQNSAQGQKVNSAIELSYNHVGDDEAKKIFLLCCLFPEDYDIPIRVLMMYGMGLRWFDGVGTVEEARNRVHALVHSLKSSSLLQDGEEEECVKMHDVIRDVAVKIASKDEVGFLVKAGTGSKVFPEEEALNRCTAISLFSDDFHELPGALECPKLKILLLGSTGSSSPVPNNFSLRTQSPKVLNLFGIDFSSPPPLMVVRNLKNLRTLCLTRCSVKDTSSIIGEELKNLEYLSFRESDIEELPEEIGMLTQLKLLDLTRCVDLKVIPRDVIGGLSQLEGLYMEDSFADWEVERQDEERKNASLGELKRLSHLISLDIRIPDADLLPEDLVFENLSRFKICIGTRFFERWEQFSHTKILSLKLNVNTALKDGIKELLKKVEHLQLSEMEGLKSVVYDLDREGFQNLRRLQVHKCGEVEYIFNASEWFSPVAFPKLEKLSLFDLPKLEEICYLPGPINLWNDPAHHLYFHNLTVVTVEDCRGLKNLFSHSVAKGLSKLVELEVLNCWTMEEIVGNDKEAESAAAVDDIIMFPKLRSLELGGLPNLKNFCLKMEGDLDTSTEEALFGKKVVFPALETLRIWCIGYSTEIQHSQLLAETLGFRNLRSINIYWCNSVKSLFSPSMASSLVQLKEVEINSCKMMESIIAEERKPEEYCQEIIVFPERRRRLRLLNLPKLISFIKTFTFIFSVRQNLLIKDEIVREALQEGNPHDPVVQPLFDQKVILPAMEVLKIEGLDNLKAIWHPLQLQAESTCQLKVLEVKSCHKISNVIPSNLLKRLTNLEELSIEECDSVEIIFEVERLGVEDRCGTMTLSQLKKLKKLSLSGLPKLCTSKHPNQQKLQMDDEEFKEKPDESNSCITIRPLFDEWVCLPALEVLEIKGLNNLKDIWHPQILAKSFCQLRVLEVESCHKISNVIPSNLLKRLTNLMEVSVKKCDLVQIIFEVEPLAVKDRHGTGTLSQLRKLELSGLLKLFTFEHPLLQNLEMDDEKIKEKPDESNSCIPIRPLFDEWVCLPTLEVLEIKGFDNLKDIWHPQLLAESFRQLRILKVESCHKISNVIPSNLLKGLKNLEEVFVKECDSLQMIFEVELLAVKDRHGTGTLPQLRKLELSGLPKLLTFEHPLLQNLEMDNEKIEEKPNESNSSIPIRPLFDELVCLPTLEVLEIKGFDNLKDIWHPQLLAESFRQLRILKVESCHKISNVIPSNLLKGLKNLEEVFVKECDSLQMIFEVELLAVKDRHGTGTLPQLRKLELSGLPKLLTFEHPLLQNLEMDNEKIEEKPNESNSSIPIRPLFDELVCLPTLEVLKIKDLDNLKDIWHPQILAKSFCQLRVLEMESCHKISNVIPSNLLKRLTNLMEVSVKKCDLVQIIFEVEPLAVKDRCGTRTLSQLRKLELSGLPKLFTFEHPLLQNLELDDEKIEEKPDESKSCIPIRPLFDELVAFTNLVELRIINIENLQEIFHTQLAYESFSQLRFLEVRECHKLSRVAPSNLLPRLKNLYELVVKECNSMENIFEVEGEGHAAFSLFKLTKVKLCHLPNLMMFCSGNCDFELPLLNDLVLEKCPKMQKFSSGLNSIPKLYIIRVEEYGYRRIEKGDLNSTIHHLFQEKAKLKSDKSSGKEVEEGAEGENASAHQGNQHVTSEIQEEA